MTHRSNQSARLHVAARESGEWDAPDHTRICARCSKTCRVDDLAFIPPYGEMCASCTSSFSRELAGRWKAKAATPSTYYSLAISFGVLILGLAWVAWIVNFAGGK
jgi:hypothetical protein